MTFTPLHLNTFKLIAIVVKYAKDSNDAISTSGADLRSALNCFREFTYVS